MTVSDLKIIVSKGGGLILDSQKYPVSELKIIASKASQSRAKVILKNPHTISVSDLKIIASKSDGCVIFDFFDI